jgi:hypothetical protein
LNLVWQPNSSQRTPKIEEYRWIGKSAEVTDEVFRHAVVQVFEYAKMANALSSYSLGHEKMANTVSHTAYMRRWRMRCSSYSLRHEKMANALFPIQPEILNSL